MEEHFLDFDYKEPKSELSKYEEKRKALKKSIKDLQREEHAEYDFRRKILEFISGTYYIIIQGRIFDKYPVYDEDGNKIIDWKFAPQLVYILYDGNFIVHLIIEETGYFHIHRSTGCKLPEVDKQLENYNIKLKPEDVGHRCGMIDDYPQLDQAKINRKLLGYEKISEADTRWREIENEFKIFVREEC